MAEGNLKVKLEEYEQIIPTVQVDGMRFFVPNTHCKWRVDTLYTKEPDTIEWISGMQAGETFYDIGANIGLYTVFAAHKGLKVFAFEPESQNYAVLCKNIVLNYLDQAVAYPLCLAKGLELNTLRLSGLLAGSSCHSFGADTNYKGEVKKFELEQGSVALQMDWVASQLGYPDHIKIDVDGFEHYVLEGGKHTIKKCKSILCEMDSNRKEHMEWQERLLGMGFVLDPDQVAKAMRTEGPFTGIGNRVFRRA